MITVLDKIRAFGAVIPLHGGVVKYFKEIGAWTDELEARQQELLEGFGSAYR